MLGVSVITSALVGVKASNLGAEVGHVSRWFFLSGPVVRGEHRRSQTMTMPSELAMGLVALTPNPQGEQVRQQCAPAHKMMETTR